MEIPEGIECDEEYRRVKVSRLKKSLYGLKVSPKRWNVRFKTAAEKMGLQADQDEPCLFTWMCGDEIAFIVLYVDDMIKASNSKDKL